MHYTELNKIDDFKIWFFHNNWIELLANIKEKFLGLQVVQSIWGYIGDEIVDKVVRKLDISKHAFKIKQYLALQNGKRFEKPISNWNKIRREIINEEMLFFYDQTRENALLLLYKGLIYLEFDDTY